MNCSHPAPRIFYWVASDVTPEKQMDILYGGCCECGELVHEKIIKEKKIGKSKR